MSATDASSGAAESATDSAEPATVPVGADTPPSGFASAPHFGSFLSTVRRSGLRILRTLDAPTLLRFAEQSLVLEEEVATGCLMIQGIALLEHFHKTNGISPIEWPDQATRTGQSSVEGWLPRSCFPLRSLYDWQASSRFCATMQQRQRQRRSQQMQATLRTRMDFVGEEEALW